MLPLHRLHGALGAALAVALVGGGCTSVLGDITFDRSTGGSDTGGAASSSSGSGGASTCSSGVCPDDPCVYFVAAAAAGAADGTSWANAFTSIQPALDAANTQVTTNGEPSCDVWVEAGTYYVYASAKTDTVSLQANVGLYGGFAGTETARDQADPTANKTILDGRKGAGSSLHVRHVVSDYDQTGAVIDGFTIQGGVADTNGAQTEEDKHGGGVLLYAFNDHDASLSVSRCEITGNTAVYGGGVAMIWGNPTLTVQSCDIHDNTVTVNGGGLSCSGAQCTVKGTKIRSNTAGNTGGGLDAGTLLIADDVTFAENVAGSGDGGGMRISGTFTGSTLTNLTFVDNFASTLGGGLRADSSTDAVTLYNAVFVGNQAASGGGAAVDTTGGLTCIGCTITANRGTMLGDGIQWATGGPTLTNTIVWGNPSAAASNQDVYPADWSSVTLSHADVHAAPAGGSVLDVDPGFVSLPAFFDRTTIASADTTSLQVASGTLYHEDDVLEIGGDGVGHTVTSIVANTVTYTPALATPAAAYTSIRNWGTALGTIDLHVASASACVDAADPDTGLPADITGQQRGSSPDIGAYESH